MFIENDEYMTGKTDQEVNQEAMRALMDEAYSENYRFDQRKEVERNRKARAFILDGIAFALRGLGHQVVYDTTEWKMEADGINVMYQLSVDYIYSREYYNRSMQTKRLKVTTGDYGNRSSYPQRKDGSFSFDKIARDLSNYVKGRVADAKRKNLIQMNSSEAGAIREEFKEYLSEYGGVVSASSRDDDKTVVINLKDISNPAVAVTPEHARKILKTLRELGFRLSYNDKGNSSK